MIDNEKLIQTYNRALESGHPDPLGLIARGKIKTGLNFEGEYKGATGTFGVDKKQAEHLGYSREELESTDLNLAASIEVDLANYREADGDLNAMHLSSNNKSKLSNTRFMKKMEKEKGKIKKTLVFSADGQLERIDNKAEPDNKNLETINKKNGNDDKKNTSIMNSKDTKEITADDIISKTKGYEFQTADKQKIDSTLQQLVKVIINEKKL